MPIPSAPNWDTNNTLLNPINMTQCIREHGFIGCPLCSDQAHMIHRVGS
jgi:hypothetical protein